MKKLIALLMLVGVCFAAGNAFQFSDPKLIASNGRLATIMIDPITTIEGDGNIFMNFNYQVEELSVELDNYGLTSHATTLSFAEVKFLKYVSIYDNLESLPDYNTLCGIYNIFNTAIIIDERAGGYQTTTVVPRYNNVAACKSENGIQETTSIKLSSEKSEKLLLSSYSLEPALMPTVDYSLVSDFGARIIHEGEYNVHLVKSIEDALGVKKIRYTFSNSNGQGVSWQSAVDLSGSDYNSGFASIARHGNTFFVMYTKELSGGYSTLEMVKSEDKGVSWGSPVALISNFQAGVYQELVAEMVVSPSGVLYAAVKGYDTSGAQYFVRVLKSENQGLSWTVIREVASDLPINSPNIRADANKLVLAYTKGNLVDFGEVVVDVFKGAQWESHPLVQPEGVVDQLNFQGMDISPNGVVVIFTRKSIGGNDIYVSRGIETPALTSGIVMDVHKNFGNFFSDGALADFSFQLKRADEKVSINWAPGQIREIDVLQISGADLSENIAMSSISKGGVVRVTEPSLAVKAATVSFSGLLGFSGIEQLQIRKDGVLMFDGTNPLLNAENPALRYTPEASGILSNVQFNEISGIGSFETVQFSSWSFGLPFEPPVLSPDLQIKGFEVTDAFDQPLAFGSDSLRVRKSDGKMSIAWAGLNPADIESLASGSLESVISIDTSTYRKVIINVDSTGDFSFLNSPAEIRLDKSLLGIHELNQLKIFYNGAQVYDGSRLESYPSGILPGYEEGFFSEEPYMEGSMVIGPIMQFSEWEFQGEGVSSGTIVSAPGYGLYLVLALFSVALAFLVAVKTKKRR